MKQIVQNYRSGELLLVDVPLPATKPGGVLVRTSHSLISTGTELMKVGESRLSLVGKAKARPDQVKRVVKSVAQQGLVATYRKVDSQLDTWTPLGYSLAGEVVAVGSGVTEFVTGQVVACAGNQYAHHAEFVWVPKNLCVAVPPGVDSRSAAFTTVGAIAMQGFRQSEAVLGEVAVVIGLGLVGQLLIQILRAAGVTVIGLDPAPERSALAERMGASGAGSPQGVEMAALETLLLDLTDGQGGDHIFLTAGGSSNDPVELAARLARDRGRVIEIGKTRLNLPWKDYYEKELDLRFSRSYGPGRYDPTYEEQGIDYPVAYVRWTERRNMESFVSLLEQGRVDVEPLISSVYPFHSAVRAYEKMASGEEPGVGVLFEYDRVTSSVSELRLPHSQAEPTDGKVRIAIIGAGNYASSMLLPHLSRHPQVVLKEVVTATSLSAANALRKFGFERSGTDVESVFSAGDIDAILIATRHRSHAEFVCRALERDVAVLVEKPLAINVDQLRQVVDTIARTGNTRIMVGFNRRFSPLLTSLRSLWKSTGPIHFRYDVNAGPLPESSWYRDPAQGSRFAGEGGHFIDTASWWIGSLPEEAAAYSSPSDRDNLVVTLRYQDGSVASISYLTDGHARYPKETIQVVGQGRIARFENFRKYDLWSSGKRLKRRMAGVDKGQNRQLDRFIESVVRGTAMPISLESLLWTTAATIATEHSVLNASPVMVEPILAADQGALTGFGQEVPADSHITG
jgi:predicted dehydrogenase/threonine dehydrogenase-like Zn-dependent dehydrogenase